MIFYFSGTGNSKWIAEQIAKAQNEVLVFMPNAIRDGIEEFVLADDEKVGFVFPVYSWGPPLSVLRFLDWITLSNYHSQYVFFVCSCGDDTGLTEELFRRALSRKGWSVMPVFQWLCLIIMFCFPDLMWIRRNWRKRSWMKQLAG